MSVYLLSMRKEKMEYIDINAWFFLVVNLLKVPFQIFAWDNITWGSFSLNLLMTPKMALKVATDDMNQESLLILLNPDFRNLLMLCNTYLQVTISPICAFL
jgi:hypothetical protein